MNEPLLLEYVKAVLVEREGDIKSLQVTRNSFLAISNFFKSIQGERPTLFDKYFTKEQGRYVAVDLNEIAPRPEHENVTLVIKDRATFQVRKGLRAQAQRELTPKRKGGYNRKYFINIFIDIDQNKLWQQYNKEFRATVYDKFINGGDNWEHFAHEFTHILDFQRLSDEYLNKRANVRLQRKVNRAAGQQGDKEGEEEAETSSSGQKSAAEEEYLNTYTNDPLETNAFIRQSFSRVLGQVKTAKNKAQFEKIMGKNAHEFVDKFFKKYLVRLARKRFDDNNRKKALKRAAAFYENMLAKYGQFEQI